MDGKTSLKFNYELYEKNKEELIKLGYEVETRFYVGIAEVYTFISWDNAKEEEAINIAQKLCNIIAAQTFKLSNNRESKVTISLGVATYGATDGTEPAKIIESADKRLYNAKENGRNRVN